ncbi:cache domain-containing sensor histidine kinase [Cohnella algarum]|uniref:sensor histidine kinase n=1 Tax=Cohnella algarum TaxID=2044859 RepID=UPI001966DD8E|nr:sensor histidine kinase [Cohnella algarum]MBN2980553.1 sensor histidine kinase [Cohnella algarum]
MRSPAFISLSVKVFAISFVSIASLIFLLGYISQNYIVETYKKQQTRYVANLLESTQLHLNLFMKNLQGNLLALSNDERLQSAADDETLIALLERERKYWNQDLKNIYLIRPDLDVVGTSDYLWDIRGHRLARNLYDGALKSEYMYWSEPYMSDVSDYTVSVGVRVSDAYGTLRGVLAADLDLESIINVYGVRDDSLNEDLLILSADLRPITVSNPFVVYDVFSESYSVSGLPAEELEASGGNSRHVDDGAGGRLYVSGVQNNNWGWRIMAVLQEEELYGSIGVLQSYILWVGLVGLLLSLIISYYLSRYVARPIKLLSKQMRRFSTGDFQTRISLPFRGEIGILVNSFNQMVRRIKGLMEELVESEREKKRFELKVLQAQIQPHFLYNTLNSISYLARHRQTEHVDRMITSLVELLHFHLDKVDEFVPIGQEVEGIRHYAYLLSVRYPDKFALEAELDDDVLAFGIPKLTIQPLVENAVFHGILAGAGPGTIVLSGRREEEEDIVLQVSDDGVGMERAVVESLFAGAQKNRRNTYYHMGIKNIHDRLQLYFGPKYGLTVASTPGEGTTVTVRLPATASPPGERPEDRATSEPEGDEPHAARIARGR